MKKTNIKDLLWKIFIKYQGLMIILICLDHFTKLLALNNLNGKSIPVLGISWFNLSLEVNEGISFSLLKNSPAWVLALVSTIAFVAIEYYLIYKKGVDSKDKLFTILLIFIGAGAIANGTDRWLGAFGREIIVNGVTKHGVIDFLDVSWFANFNVADIYVTVSCFVLIFYIFFSKDDDDISLKEMINAKKKLKEENKNKDGNNN